MLRRTEPASGLLIATLIAALLATAAGVLISSGRATRSAVQEETRIVRARYEAQGIADAAIVDMDSGSTALRLDGSATPPRFGQGGRLSLQDVGGLVDLNSAEPSQLAALFKSLGYSDVAAATFADRIADWRDPVHAKRLHGADDDDYVAAGLPPPAHRPFVTELEVEKVLGVTASLAQCLAPYVTVFSGASAVNVAVAPIELRTILGLATTTGGGAPLGTPIGHVILVTAEAPISQDAMIRLREWVRLTADRRNPVMIHRAMIDFAPAIPQAAPAGCAAPTESRS